MKSSLAWNWEVVYVGLGASPTSNSGGIKPDTTRISTETEVCLVAPGFKVEDYQGKAQNCREQPVPFTQASTWRWVVTAQPEIKELGERPIDITVNALLKGFATYSIYTSRHTAYVYVAPPSMLSRFVSFIDEFKALILGLAAIVTALPPVAKWLRSRRDKEKGKSGRKTPKRPGVRRLHRRRSD